MSSILMSRRLSSKLSNLSPSCVCSHFISQKTQNPVFRLFRHYSSSPFSQEQNPFNPNEHFVRSSLSFTSPTKNLILQVQNPFNPNEHFVRSSLSFTSPTKNHDFALSAVEKSRFFSTFTREKSPIPGLKNKEMTLTKPLSSSIDTQLTHQKPRCFSSSDSPSDPEKSHNANKIPKFKHQEREEPIAGRDPNENREVGAMLMKKLHGLMKIGGLLGLVSIGLAASIDYITKGTIPIKEVFDSCGLIITGTIWLMQLCKSAEKRGTPDFFMGVLWELKSLILLLQLTYLLWGFLLVLILGGLMVLPLGMDALE
ncbi:hypothetical protein P3X46_033973 [Hevea brasiliensis]|uniref:Uncharacterized protein n=1 Tax=Hevea brasiliensis TaxID=3981 RepID=A0ABQ9K9Z1_HEVBR|nr:hypothetical protein P3X46_033973 [Hevea brasiliensis]